MKHIIAALLLVSSLCAAAQQPYVEGSSVKDFSIGRILNYATPVTTLRDLQKDLTIIDFFGTWCAPCIRALPHLQDLQQRYRDRLQVVLVSVEEEGKLRDFIAKRNNLTLPLVVDKDEFITRLFQPPSYPYTVVLHRSGVVLALLLGGGEVADSTIKGWLLQATLTSRIPSQNIITQKAAPVSPAPKSTNSMIALSQKFLYAAKTGDSVQAFRQQLQELDGTGLRHSLKGDEEKKAFWINIYNGFTNAILKAAPEQYQRRGRFFKAKQIFIAGEAFSLDDIEHDLLRRSKVKWSLGYLSKLAPSKRTRQLRVDALDYRIHFALNCGAKSCPPIAYYTPEGIDAQLEVATKSYLGSEVEWDREKNTLRLPALMSWFRADFGGKKGMILILKKHGIIPEEANPRIRFKKYDWTLELNNYKIE